MALVLTPEQQHQIDPKRVADSKLAKVFNRATGVDEPISRDFEAVLITLARGPKQAAVSWANALADENPQQEDLRAVIAQFLDVEYDSLAQRAEQAMDGLGDFDAIRAGLSKMNLQGGQSVPEVQRLVADLNALVGEHAEKAEIAISGLIVNRLQSKRLVDGKEIDGIRREVRSFVPALLSY